MSRAHWAPAGAREEAPARDEAAARTWAAVMGFWPLGTSFTVFRCVFMATSTPAGGAQRAQRNGGGIGEGAACRHHGERRSGGKRTTPTCDRAVHHRAVLQLYLDLLVRQLHQKPAAAMAGREQRKGNEQRWRAAGERRQPAGACGRAPTSRAAHLCRCMSRPSCWSPWRTHRTSFTIAATDAAPGRKLQGPAGLAAGAGRGAAPCGSAAPGLQALNADRGAPCARPGLCKAEARRESWWQRAWMASEMLMGAGRLAMLPVFCSGRPNPARAP